MTARIYPTLSRLAGGWKALMVWQINHETSQQAVSATRITEKAGLAISGVTVEVNGFNPASGEQHQPHLGGNMWIQEWVDERFGVPNTVNIQVYEDFAIEVERRTSSYYQHIRIALQQFPFMSKEQLISIVILHFYLPDKEAEEVVEQAIITMGLALKGESNEFTER